VGVQVIGIIGAGGIFTLAGARCSEVVLKKEEKERERKKRERGRRDFTTATCFFDTLVFPQRVPRRFTSLWLSDCEWNQLDGREVGLDLIIGDFGGM